MTMYPPEAASHNLLTPAMTSLLVPASVAQAGPAAAERFLEFFAATIRNPNTRAAYARALREFFGWTQARGLGLPAIRPLHVAAYVEGLAGAEACGQSG